MRLLSRKNRNGFTVAEVLIAVAILVALFAVSFPMILTLRRNLRQKEYDSKAEIVYIAAQNELVKLRSSGNASRYTTANDNAAKVYPLPAEPGDRSIDIDENGDPIPVPRLYYISSEYLSDENSAASLVMQEMTADSELVGGAWIIEFIPGSGSVYAVFYSEMIDLRDYYSNWEHYNKLRYRDNRLSDNARVGYYGGDSVGTSSTATLQPVISITNAETLSATFQCLRPSISGEDLIFHITLSDNEGHSYGVDYTYGSLDHNLERDGRSYHTTITFDDLSSEATRFNKLYGSESGHGDKCLVPGTELTVTLTVRSPNKLIEPASVTAVTNSLFANESNMFIDGIHNNTAVVEYARHLQNLDVLYDEEAGRFNNANVTRAVQAKTVSFRDGMSENDWYSTYCGQENDYFNGKDEDGNAKFKPIALGPGFTLFDGRNNDTEKLLFGTQSVIASDNCAIEGLIVSETGNAGLFADIDGQDDITFRNVSLVGARVSGTGSVGAFTGAINGSDAGFENCRVYLSKNEGDLNDKDEKDLWISGGYAGGLVGVVAGDSRVSVSDSFASTVLNGVNAAGGLIGRSLGTAQISGSYADSYVYGRETAGLIGATGPAGSISLTDCYAAGFLYPENVAAGLVNGIVSGMSNCYTICAMEDESLTYYSTVREIVSGNRADAVYYFRPGSKSDYNIFGSIDISGRTSSELCAALGGADGKYTVNTSTTTNPYNLMGQTLSVYSYPRLKANEHYGDWQAEFQVGSLVYYEKYIINGVPSYGFHGGNVTSTLTANGTIVGDGYGIVYRAGDAHPDSVPVNINGQTYTLNLVTGYHTVYGKDGMEYHIYPFPTALLNAEDPSGNFYQKVVIGTDDPGHGGDSVDTYYYNPYFAKTVRTVPYDFIGDYPVAEDDQIAVRSARHLYDLSLYYDVYADELDPKNVTFLQERDISYSGYDWNGFYKAGVRRVDRQEPIGRTDAHHFKCNYNGQCYSIKDVSFVSQSDNYVGLFGYNEGELRNIVVRTDYTVDGDNYLVKRKDDIGSNTYVYMGVLAGCNGREGVINNCAVAGYFISGSDGTIHAYANSHLYVGGLVGNNEGRIQNSASDLPMLRLSTLNAEGYIGGFVGANNNAGMIYNCYSLGHLNVAYSSGGSINLSGFAGVNRGSVTNSYCAVSLLSAGETSITYAFAPKGGAVTNNYYLDRGTYTYINQLHSYNGNTERTTGISCTRNELIALRGRSRVDSAHTFNYPNTKSSDQAFPYRGVVRDRTGAYVHYGDWQDDAVLGTLGVFYWEHEQHGANDGYHLTYVGTDEGLSDLNTTLCNEHDDGGEITEFGYGYYVKVGQEDRVTAEIENMVWSGKDRINAAAKKQLQTQMQDYIFYPFTTKMTRTGDYICMNGGPNDRDGKITLSFLNGAGETSTYEYLISPFFANAIQVVDKSSNPAARTLKASDGTVTDYSKPLGSAKNPYETRSIEQFQYINWNCETKSCSTLVYGEENKQNVGNFKKFPYLQYATVLTKGKQPRSAVEALRSPQYWMQSHDLHGRDGYVVTPIAGMATSSPVSNGNYRNILYAWFGGSYDGQNYKIQNVDVISEAYTVGLFGVVAGADVKNIVMYANDGKSMVKRDTAGKTEVTISGKTLNFEKGPGAYSLGGLFGIAYEYRFDENGRTISVLTNKIENCAIAGYKVIDASTNQHGAGTANVGGLIGLANINLERCSSVSEIILDCTHEYGHMAWGSYFRIGGLAGSAGAPGAQVTLKNCYTGGSITVTERTLSEKPTKFDSNRFALRDEGSVGYSSNLFISGMIGGSYAPNISNFTEQESNAPDGTANIENCYTYLQLPDLEGTIRSVSLFASQADRYCGKSVINIKNCYYLSSIAENIKHPDREDPTTWPEYFFKSSTNQSTTKKAPTEEEWRILRNEDGTADPVVRAKLIDTFKKLVISEDQFLEMLNGDLTCLRIYLNAQNSDHNNAPLPADPVDYAAMSDQSEENSMATVLDGESSAGVWSWVTVTEGLGAQIDGKYSFSSNPAQNGKNYPFPTVITQKDLTYGNTVNVHYGEWPVDGVYWTEGLAEMDIFDDMQPADENGVRWAEKVFTLVDSKNLLENAELGLESFEVSPSDIAQIVSVERRTDDPSMIDVKVRALKDGAVTVTEKESGMSVSFVLNITADIMITSDPERVVNYMPKKPTDTVFSPVTLIAVSSNGQNFFSEDGEWTIEDNPQISYEIDEDHPNLITIQHYDPCSINLETIFTYVYNGRTYQTGGFLPVKTHGYIGLASIPALNNGVSTYVYAIRQPSGRPEAKTPDYTGKVPPMLPEGIEGEFYLYEAVSEQSLYQFRISLIWVTDLSTGRLYAYSYDEDGKVTYSGTGESPFEITLSDPADMISDANYSYLPGNIRYVGDGASPRVSLSITLEHEEDFTIRNGVKTYAKYVFALSLQTHNRLVSFDANGGTGFTDPIRTSGGDVTLPACGFVNTGYLFDGWYYEEEDLTFQPGDLFNVTGDVTLKAKWRPITYTVEFYPSFTTDQTMEPMDFVYDEAQFLAENTFVNGSNRFMGWATRSGGSVIYKDKELVVNLTVNDGEAVKLYAVWAAEYTLTLDPNTEDDGYQPQEFTILSGFTAELEGYVEPERDGCVLIGWFTARESGTKILNSNGSIANAIPGYTTSNGFALNRDTVLYAHWEKIPMLTLDPNTGDAADQPQIFRILDNEVTSLNGYSAPEKTGFLLDGWYTDPTAGDKVLDANGNIVAEVIGYTGGGRFAMVEDKTLYAHWYELPSIILDPNAEGLDTAEYPIADDTISVLEGYIAPDRGEGYDLLGWYTAAEDGVKVLNADGTIAAAVEGYTDGTHFVIREDKTLYAHWYKYPVLILDANTEVADPSEYPILNSTTSQLAGYYPPYRPKYELLGWYTEAEGGQKVLNADGSIAGAVEGYTDGTYFTITEDKTVYAHWKKITGIILVANGVSTEYEIGDFHSQYTWPWREGYEFDGWYTVANLEGKRAKVLDTNGYPIADNIEGYVENGEILPGITLYAKWVQPGTVIAENWNPERDSNGELNIKWKFSQTIDWDAGQYIEVSMYLNNNQIDKQNIISFSNTEAGLNLYSNASSFHMYYPRKSDTAVPSQYRPTTISLTVSGVRLYNYNYNNCQLVVQFHKDGIYINDPATGEMLPVRSWVMKGNIPAQYENNVSLVTSSNTIWFGSVEGNNRSNAHSYRFRIMNEPIYG